MIRSGWLAVITLAALWLPASASAGVAGRVFTVAGNNSPWQVPSTVATEASMEPRAISVGPRGDLVVLDRSDSSARVVRVDRSGLLATIDSWAVPSSFPSDVSVGPTGEVYVAHKGLLRLTPAGPPSLLARSLSPGARFGRVAAETDGSVLVTSGVDGLLRWRPDGSISVVAGPVPTGDGRPATDVDFRTLADIFATPDGSILMSDHFGRVITASSDGTFHELSGRVSTGGSWWAIAALGNGHALLTTARHLLDIDGNGRRRVVAGSSSSRTLIADGDGLPARRAVIHPRDVAVAADGSIFFIDGSRVRFIAPRRPRRLAAALLVANGRASTARYRARYAITLRGDVKLTLWRVTEFDSTWVASRSGRGTSGTANRLTVPAPPNPGLYQIELAADTAAGQTARQTISLFLGGRLPFAWGRAIADPNFVSENAEATSADEDDGDATESDTSRVGSCASVTPSRVDCQIGSGSSQSTSVSCDHMSSVQLQPTGEIIKRLYRCRRRSGPAVRLHPRWTTPPQLVDLDVLAGSTSWPPGLGPAA